MCNITYRVQLGFTGLQQRLRTRKSSLRTETRGRSQSDSPRCCSLLQTPDQLFGVGSAAAVCAGSGGLNGLQELKVEFRNDDDDGDEEQTVHSLTGENTELTSQTHTVQKIEIMTLYDTCAQNHITRVYNFYSHFKTS